MKLIIKKGYKDSTIRIVANDEKTIVFGVVGTVSDLLKEHILEWCEYDPDAWCFIPKYGNNNARFGKSREEVLEGLYGRKIKA